MTEGATAVINIKRKKGTQLPPGPHFCPVRYFIYIFLNKT